MMADRAAIWAQILPTALPWLLLTLAAYVLADRVFRASGQRAWANPVLLSMLLVGGFLIMSGMDYATYFEGAQFIHFMLGPATVALALPIHENRHRIRKAALPIMAAVLAGSVMAVASALVIGRFLGLPAVLQASIAPKSATTAVSFGISEAIGGLPTLTAALVSVTGVMGAMLALPFALGVILAPLSWVHLPLALAWICGYGAVYHLMLAVKTGRWARIRPQLVACLVPAVVGGLLVVVGLALLTGAFSAFAYWLLETFPGLAMLG